MTSLVIMVHTRSAAGRSRRKYRALDLGFAPPPVFYGVESSHPSVTPPTVFYGVESSNQHTIPPPPWGVRGPYPRPARRSALWADFTDSDDEGAAQAVPPLSGDCLDTINRALGIIELQSRLLAAPLPPRTISLDARLPSSDCALETLLMDPIQIYIYINTYIYI